MCGWIDNIVDGGMRTKARNLFKNPDGANNSVGQVPFGQFSGPPIYKEVGPNCCGLVAFIRDIKIADSFPVPGSETFSISGNDSPGFVSPFIFMRELEKCYLERNVGTEKFDAGNVLVIDRSIVEDVGRGSLITTVGFDHTCIYLGQTNPFFLKILESATLSTGGRVYRIGDWDMIKNSERDGYSVRYFEEKK